MSRPGTVAAIAPAKVNLWLEVLGRRDDGYHEVETWMLAVDLCDRIEARRSDTPGIRLSIRGDERASDLPGGRANLAWRGAEEVISTAGAAGLLDPARAGLDLVLEKRIPSQAGLGGGSSDAAAAWVATSAALGLELRPEAGQASLSALGSDCAFFLQAAGTGSAHCTGRGEQVREAPAPERGWSIALATPDLACPTAQVYAALRRGPRAEGSAPGLPAGWSGMAAREVRPFVFNRLEAAAMDAVPRLRAWRALLDGLGAGLWHLSGSGSSYFALCDERAEAEEALERLRGACRRGGLALRGAWVVRPAGHGAKESEFT